MSGAALIGLKAGPEATSPLTAPTALAGLHDAAPQAIVLVAKRRGRWEGWRWSDLSTRVQGVATRLTAHGVTAASTLALSGPLTPTLLIVVLAARTLGAKVVEVDPGVDEFTLAALWDRLAPTHAYLQSPHSVDQWTAGARGRAQARAPITLFTPHLSGPVDPTWPVVALEDGVVGDASPSPTQAGGDLADIARGRSTLWAEEGSEWSGGLDTIVSAWLGAGAILWLPESPDSATRDRREAAPGRTCVSPLRREQWRAGLLDRLPAPGWWRTRIEAALSEPGGGGWLRRRVARLHGLPADELRELWGHAGAGPTVQPVEAPQVAGSELRA